MHQSQRMSNLMCSHIAQRTSHRFIIKDCLTHFRIYGSRLYKSPVVQQFHNIGIEEHIALNNLPRTRVGTGRPHRILFRGGNHPVATITDIIRIKIRIIFGVVFRYDGVFKSDLFKCNLPVFNSLFDVIPPFVGNSGIYIIDYRFLRFHQFPFFITFPIFGFRLQVPSVDIG